MTEIAKSDLFFFVTTIVVIALGVFLLVALVYLIRILRDVDAIAKIIKGQSQTWAAELATWRQKLKIGTAQKVIGWAVGLWRQNKGRRPRGSK